ncbi:hypothetical protein [Flavobacterium sp.]|uniref:hypothetical protein n=1 Tax=Flavobacterium sp. TaxID=239 RepID=UPI0038FCEE04
MINNLDIFDSVKSEAIKELSSEILETTFDLMTDSEVLKEIPIFGLGFKSYGLYQTLTESFFVKKLMKFLFELKEIPFDKRQKFIQDLEDKEETTKAGEKLLITLTRLNDADKATIIGRLFKHTILGEIEFNDFNRLSHIIDNAFTNDLMLLKKNPHLGYIDENIKSNLNQLGLLKQSISDFQKHQEFLDRQGSGSKAIPKLQYEANEYCKILINYGLE